MDDLAQEVARTAERAVAMSQNRDGEALDYSEESLTIVEEILEEAAEWAGEMSARQLEILSQDLGCYILEVARRELGGRYAWFEKRNQPVLVVGEPNFRIALIAWDKVKGRLSGDRADNIPFFFDGFAERVWKAVPGDDALYV